MSRIETRIKRLEEAVGKVHNHPVFQWVEPEQEVEDDPDNSVVFVSWATGGEGAQ